MRAAISSRKRRAEATAPKNEKLLATVTSAAKPRYAMAAAVKLAKKYCPNGFHVPRAAAKASTQMTTKTSLPSTGAAGRVNHSAARYPATKAPTAPSSTPAIREAKLARDPTVKRRSAAIPRLKLQTMKTLKSTWGLAFQVAVTDSINSR